MDFTGGVAAGRRTLKISSVAGAVVVAGLLGACSSTSTTSSTSSTPGGTGTSAPATSVAGSTPARTGSTLPASIGLPLDVVKKAFPEVTKVAESGADQTAIANPIASWSVFYTDASGEKKVTLSVGQYATVDDAKAAYAEAVQASKDAPGFKLASSPNLGEESFAGTSQVGDQMHFGLGGRDGRLIIAATHAGIPVSPENSAKVAALASDQLALAKQTLGSGAG